MPILQFASFSKLQGAKDDDWADRASHLYTVVLLIFLTFLVSSAHLVGDPIHCWCPANFPNSQVAYTKSICWVTNTYYVASEEAIPLKIEKREAGQITYYQWVPIILLFMALLFKMPNVIWKIGATSCGLNMQKLVEMSEETVVSDPKSRQERVVSLAKYLHHWLSTYRNYNYNNWIKVRQKFSGVFCFWLSKRDGSFLTGFYLFTKCLYAANVITQFFLLNKFLSMDFHIFGFEVLDKAVRGEEITENHRFPRVTLCDFLIRQMNNVQRYTVQCVLPINLFNEKVFLVLWFWLFLLAVACLANLGRWLFWVLARQNRVSFVKKYLKLSDQIHTSDDRRWCRKFANAYLRNDGIFVLKVVGSNSSELALKDLILQLWLIFKKTHIDYAVREETTELLDGNGDLDKDRKSGRPLPEVIE